MKSSNSSTTYLKKNHSQSTPNTFPQPTTQPTTLHVASMAIPRFCSPQSPSQNQFDPGLWTLMPPSYQPSCLLYTRASLDPRGQSPAGPNEPSSVMPLNISSRKRKKTSSMNMAL